MSNKFPINDNALYAFETAEYIKHTHGKLWWIGFTLVFVLLMGFFAWQQNWIAYFVLALFFCSYLVVSHHEPRLSPVTISDQGIYFGHHFFPHHQTEHFWIMDHGEHDRTVLHFEIVKGKYHRHIMAIDMTTEHPDDIRRVLSDHLEENLDGHEIGHDFWDRLLKVWELCKSEIINNKIQTNFNI